MTRREQLSENSPPTALQFGGQAMRVLKDVFGFHSFLPDQEEIVQAILDKQDASESNAARIRAIADDFDRKPGAIRSRLKKLGLIEA